MGRRPGTRSSPLNIHTSRGVPSGARLFPLTYQEAEATLKSDFPARAARGPLGVNGLHVWERERNQARMSDIRPRPGLAHQTAAKRPAAVPNAPT